MAKQDLWQHRITDQMFTLLNMDASWKQLLISNWAQYDWQTFMSVRDFGIPFSNYWPPQFFWGKLLQKIGTLIQDSSLPQIHLFWLHVLYQWNPLWHSLSHKAWVMKIRRVSTFSSFLKFIGTLPVVWHMNIQDSSPMCQNVLWIIYSFILKSCPFSFGNVCINTDFSISWYW